jgi:aminoglycoside phosphotransferase (APT) family kinase protein
VVVLDWTMADLGDPHADVGNSLMLMDCVPVKRKRIWQNVGVAIGRGFLRALFLRASNRLRPLDPDILAYYQAWAALRWLVRVRQWLSDGPKPDDWKRSAGRRVRPRHLRTLSRYFRARTGVAVMHG